MKILNFLFFPFTKTYFPFFVGGILFSLLWFWGLGLGIGILLGMGNPSGSIGNLFIIFLFGGYLLISVLISNAKKSAEKSFGKILFSFTSVTLIYFLIFIVLGIIDLYTRQ